MVQPLLHAGSKLNDPYRNIFIRTGSNLLKCQVEAWEKQGESGSHVIRGLENASDENADTCGICGDGGELLCCDSCPSTFHHSCLGIQILPKGDWRCPNCQCSTCRGVSTAKKPLHECCQCDKKYHRNCFLAAGRIVDPRGFTFCGQSCKERYDAVVGDVMITENRSLYVDFTLPYAVGGVFMVMPIKYKDQDNAWIFVKPFSKSLWLTSGAFFIITGFVIWVLEHRVNDSLRGPTSQHVGMLFWFSFSTLVFAHSEKVVSNLTRFVVIIWIFVVLILSSSYTASLSSMLTMKQLKPTDTSIQELLKKGEYVGCQLGTFIRALLKQLKFEAPNLSSIILQCSTMKRFRRGAKMVALLPILIQCVISTFSWLEHVVSRGNKIVSTIMATKGRMGCINWRDFVSYNWRSGCSSNSCRIQCFSTYIRNSDPRDWSKWVCSCSKCCRISDWLYCCHCVVWR